MHPCTGTEALYRPYGLKGDYGTRRGWRVSVTPRPLFTPGKDPVSILREDGWAPGPVWTGAENLVPTGIWSPDRSARSQSLYRLRYTAHTVSDIIHLYCCRLVWWTRWNVFFHLVPDNSRQQYRWNISEAVNTVKCSWWWAKTSPETCRAGWD